MSHPSLDTKHALLAKAGSFWGEGLTESARMDARRLAHMGTVRPQDMLLESCVNWAAGDADVWVHGEERMFSENDIGTPFGISQERLRMVADGVVVTFRPRHPLHPNGGTALLFTENDNAFEALAAESGEFLLWPAEPDAQPVYLPDEYRPVWFVPWDEELDTSALQSTGGRLLLAGVDFVQSANVLTLYIHPLQLFPDRKIQIVAARRRQRSVHSFTMKLEGVAGPTQYIARWQRDRQSPKALKLALAQACGRVICPRDTFVLAVAAEGEGARYTCEGFDLRVPYAHTRLSAGDFLEAEEIVGGGFNVLKGPGDSHWWRALDWSGGLSLDDLCPVSGLTVPDAQIRLDVDPTTTDSLNGIYHVRPHIQGSDAVLTRYWQWLEFSEDATGILLDAAVGLGSKDDAHYANGIDFYFSNLLGVRAMIVQLPASLSATELRVARTFLKQEQPLGVVLLRTDG